MSDAAGWSLTESDPGIMTGILHELGLKSLDVEELYALDPSLLNSFEPLHALIFLFKWIGPKEPSTSGGLYVEIPDEKGYFAHQVINNACASIALINAVMNLGEDWDLGDELSNLKMFSTGLGAEDKGWTISNSEKIRQVHNSFARADPFHLEESRPPTDDDHAYHFICYVPISDTLYELDGLKPSPVSHGVIPGGKEKWALHAKECVSNPFQKELLRSSNHHSLHFPSPSSVLERRISTHPPGEVMFNLLCITSRRHQLEQKLAKIQSSTSAGSGDDGSEWEMKEQLKEIEERLKGWEVENELRRHNYVGLIHALLLELARKGELTPAIEGAKKTMQKKVEERKSKGQEMELDD
ncbi:BQ2448_2941 [Microbotryum intermedium]|uniref:Ubiquitin carboxyl-terminal hydrolase n=1 Tax=Microbotryum intermedium TaxID=269621 RepID=A0A238FH71_9BASI|nr:BQ2448_2941 [Microbotryum intermedium]